MESRRARMLICGSYFSVFVDRDSRWSAVVMEQTQLIVFALEPVPVVCVWKLVNLNGLYLQTLEGECDMKL